ncbi:MAG: Phosphoribosylaminoimidazole-succinocarboxamide synthase [Candidatus Omnitrophica bacterium]|nr:Phosphoribosylaminoimidazole-succinocarboxamide synthase [Candidatus Omnitrophota bacterium]
MATETTVLETDLPLKRVSRGKVRDIYAHGEDRLLIVTTDRLSAFDVVLPTPVPDKGRVLNSISAFWFAKLKGIVPNHLVTTDLSRMGLDRALLKRYGRRLRGRTALVRRARPFPIECVVRGYLAGSGWQEYLKDGRVCGVPLPKGLKQCSKLTRPIFTPATKAETGHDENISFERAASLVGARTAARLRDLSLRLYAAGAAHARKRGILIADTKFEFGLLDGRIILIDEVMTPDSSRFWPALGYEAGHDQPSFDKQIVRNYLMTLDWDRRPPGPTLPSAVRDKTASAYRRAYHLLTGKRLS